MFILLISTYNGENNSTNWEITLLAINIDPLVLIFELYLLTTWNLALSFRLNEVKLDITETFHAADRDAWRQWLSDNHATAKEIWLLYYKPESGKTRVEYIHAVEEALCFGWIDGIAKKVAPDCTAQRFTPRRPKGNWTELNKERVRRLIASGKMTEAGLRVAPDLSVDNFRIPDDILAAIQADPQAWEYFQAFEPLYVRIRISYIEIARKQPEEFQKRLALFLDKTRQNIQFGGMV